MSGAFQYIKGAVLPQDYPPGNLPEFALAGRSNAGKSSFLNAIANGKIAHVSQSPGKTRILNFFSCGEKYRVVDMPGYGYASRSGDEISEWSKMIETYLANRPCLKGLVLIMDIRRDWQEDESLLIRFASQVHLPMVVVLTKADKCSKSEVQKRIKILKAQIEEDSIDDTVQQIFPVSTIKKDGIEMVDNYIYKTWLRGTK